MEYATKLGFQLDDSMEMMMLMKCAKPLSPHLEGLLNLTSKHANDAAEVCKATEPTQFAR